MRRRNGHERWRSLAAAALDGPLAPADAEGLRHHLAACPACRAATRDYRDQRQALRGLPARTPPRDMWARTSAALDREIVRRPAAFTGPAQRRAGIIAGAAAASLAAVGMSLGLVGTQTVPIGTDTSPTSRVAVLRPTPFTIPSEALAFVGSGIEGLTVYRTRVDRVCPAAAIDCVDYPESTPSVVTLPRDLQPANVSLSPNGARLAIQARDRDGGQTIAVAIIPADSLPDRRGGSAGTSGTPTPAPASPTVAAPTSAPVATASATPAFASVSPLLLPSPEVVPSPTEDLAAPSTNVEVPAPTAGDDDTVLAILEDVIAVGAPPAWSADGTALAFSAMPADGRHGPDVYIWRAYDEKAQPLTSDHDSYFASWAGPRVVVSRIVRPPETDGADATDTAEEPDPADDTAAASQAADPASAEDVSTHGERDAESTPAEASHDSGSDEVPTPSPGAADAPAISPSAGAPSAEIVVIDPLTGEQREAAPSGLWLPSVSPQGAHVVGWRGTLDASSTEVRPLAGELYIADWSLLDPFGRASLPASAGTSAVADALDDPMPSPAATAAHRPPGFVPVEPGTDGDAGDVQDWQVRWSPDGSVVGWWIADVPGASWGRLTVIAIDPQTGALAHDRPLLAPSLARRTFTLGVHRVAWVAPSDSQPDGELRIRTWGPDGFGGLRLRPIQPGEVIPAS